MFKVVLPDLYVTSVRGALPNGRLIMIFVGCDMIFLMLCALTSIPTVITESSLVTSNVSSTAWFYVCCKFNDQEADIGVASAALETYTRV